MTVHLDNPRAAVMKNQTKALSFSVLFHDGEKLTHVIANCRLMDGIIHAPSIFMKKTKTYYPSVYLCEEYCEAVYNAICNIGWTARFELPPMEPLVKSINAIRLTNDVALKIAPGCV